MSSAPLNEAAIFNAARRIASNEERISYLNQACGDDVALRGRVERLLATYFEESQFLETPAPELEATLISEPARDVVSSLDGGLSAAFHEGEAVVIGHTGHSVLKAIGQTVAVPRVVLRDEKGAGPIVRPQSAQIPQRDSDSRYRLDGEIARGGMGAILKGRDTDLGRELAIKVLLDQHKDKPEVIQRFVEEAQIGGQLQHPGIAPIYELGQFADKRPFFAMKLVKGETLSKLLLARADVSVDRGRFVGIFEQICQTMAYAHSRGVIHRDLKPANIMVGAFGEVQVMDWGLAKVLTSGGVADEKKSHDEHQGHSVIQTLRSNTGSDTPFGDVGSQTQMGSVMGTPAYMPPEQALGEIDHLDERADVFGLGAILSEILTGKPPYVAADGTQVFRMASRGKLADCFLRLDNCGADPELIALAKYCLQLEPKDRPRDAGVLAARVSGYIESVESKLHATETQRAVQAERLEQQQRAARKLQKMIAGLAAVSLVAIGTSLVASKLWNDADALRRKAESSEILATREAIHANEQRTIAQENLEKADKAEKEAIGQRDAARRSQLDALDQTYRATLNEIRARRFAHQSGWRSAALDKIQTLVQLGSRNLDHVELRTEALACLAEIDLRFHSHPTAGYMGWRVAYSPDGLIVAGDANNVICLQDLVADKVLPSIPKAYMLSPFAFHPSGPLAVAVAGGRVKFHTLRPGQPSFPEIVCEGHAINFAFDGSGDRIAIISGDVSTDIGHPKLIREVAVYNTATGERLWKTDLSAKMPNHYKTALALSPDGKTLATVGPNNELRLFSVGSDDPPVVLGKFDVRICAIAFRPDGTSLVAAGVMVGAVWDLKTKSELFRIHAPEGGFWDVAFSPDGQLIGGITNDAIARLWDARTGRELVSAPSGTGHIGLSMAFSPTSDQMAMGGGPSAILEIEGRRECRYDHSTNNYVQTMAFDNKRKTLLVGGGDHEVRSVNLIKPVTTLLRRLALRSSAMSLSPDGRHIVHGLGIFRGKAAPDEYPVCIWPVDDLQSERQLAGPKKFVISLAFNPTGRTLAATTSGDGLYVWDFDTETQRNHINLAGSEIAFIDEVHLVAVSGKRILVVDVTDGTVHPQVSFPDSIRAMVLTPDKQQAFVVEGDGVVHRVRLSDLKVVQSQPVLQQQSTIEMAISPDGRLLALTTQDGPHYLLIDARTLQPLARLPEHDKRLRSILFDADGHYLAMGGAQVALWDLDLVQGKLTQLGLDLGELNLDQAVTRFADAIDRAPGRAAKAVLIASAAPIPGLLEQLGARSPNDVLFQMELARHYSQQGNRELVEAPSARARVLLQQQLTKEPDDVAAAGQLAELLLPSMIQPIVPTSEKSAIQWRFTTAEPDKSWANPDFDDAAWSKGAAPFATSDFNLNKSLWNQRHIWIRRNFELTPSANTASLYLLRLLSDDRVEVYLNGTEVARRANYTNNRYVTVELDATIHDLLKTGTNTLAVHCENLQFSGYIDVGLSVLPDKTFSRAKTRHGATLLVDPWDRLAAAYYLAGNQPALDDLLSRHPAANIAIGNLLMASEGWHRAGEFYNNAITAETNDPQLLASRAKAFARADQWNPAKSDWQRAVALQPSLLQEAFDEFKRSSRWNDAAEFGLQVLELHPEETRSWLAIAPVLEQADDQAIYTDFCARLIERFADSGSPYQAEQIIKCCCLRPAMAEQAKQLAEKLNKVLDDGTAARDFQPWGWGTRALMAYRSGDSKSAVTFVTKSESLKPTEFAHALNLVILALARQQLRQPIEAKKSFDQASLAIQLLQADSKNSIHHDLLITQILLREAESLINPSGK